MVNTGKNLEGTKRRVKWRFGWSDSDLEHEIVLIHSLISGKKVNNVFIFKLLRINPIHVLFLMFYVYLILPLNIYYDFNRQFLKMEKK